MLAAALLTAAHQAYARAGADRPPDYHIFLPADWQDRQDAIAEAGWRREAARQAGLTVALERLGFEWTPDAGPLAQARQDVRFYREKMLGQRAWWRVAQTPDGDLAGVGIPPQNTDYAVVGYLGVPPEHRGHG